MRFISKRGGSEAWCRRMLNFWLLPGRKSIQSGLRITWVRLGIETLAHQADEYVEVEAFERSIEIYKRLIKSYAG